MKATLKQNGGIACSIYSFALVEVRIKIHVVRKYYFKKSLEIILAQGFSVPVTYFSLQQCFI